VAVQTREELERWVERYIEVDKTSDLDLLLEVMADDIVREQVGAEALRGKEQLREGLAAFYDAFTYEPTEIEQVLIDPPYVVMRQRATMTQKATGKRAVWRGCVVVEVREGLARSIVAYADNASFLAQLS
jgi:hypothetical protein